ncbi:protein anoxia up-regulated isoform X4 [Drosophila kikkawai]|uniref:Protein anoxia up-regulated n=5 Tax=melanogaster group TaxID=32346 RepID=FAU_DROME|eukprot:NP_731505.1 fau [Drosophila melanogaster]
MVYESGFTTRRTYSSRPVTTSYAVTTPRLDLCTDRPGSHRSRASSDYSYTSKSSVEKSSYDSSNPHSYRPERSTYTSTVEKTSRSGPGGSYNYSTERTSTTGAGPGGYSYSSTTSGNLPGGTKYRHFSYHV